MIRRFGEPIRHDQRYRKRQGIYAVLAHGNAVLLTHQMEPEPEFQLPGGGIDPGEHPIPALHREVREETGWKIDQLRRLGAFRRFTFMPEYNSWAEKICQVYLARPALCLGPPEEQGHTAIWANFPDAISLVENEGDRMFLRKVSAGL